MSDAAGRFAEGDMIAPELAAMLAATFLATAGAYGLWRGGQRPRRLRQLANEGALVLDVRTRKQYASGHADGALNIPAAELASRQGEIGAHERAVLVYGPSVVQAALAAQKLRSLGFHTIISAGTLTRCQKQLLDA